MIDNPEVAFAVYVYAELMAAKHWTPEDSAILNARKAAFLAGWEARRKYDEQASSR